MKKTVLSYLGLWGGGILVALAVLYSLFWLYMADQINQEIDRFLISLQDKEITVIVREKRLTGFPFHYELAFDGRIAAEGVVIDVPALRLRSSVWNNRHLHATLPQGFTTTGTNPQALWSLDYLELGGDVPSSLPDTLTYEDLSAWRAQKGRIAINSFALRKGTLHLEAAGFIELDDTLQPQGAFNARMSGHMGFISWLQGEGLIDNRTALLSAAIFSGLSRTDKETQEPKIEIGMSLQNRTLFAGPAQLMTLPVIDWPYRADLPPALP